MGHALSSMHKPEHNSIPFSITPVSSTEIVSVLSTLLAQIPELHHKTVEISVDIWEH